MKSLGIVNKPKLSININTLEKFVILIFKNNKLNNNLEKHW